MSILMREVWSADEREGKAATGSGHTELTRILFTFNLESSTYIEK